MKTILFLAVTLLFTSSKVFAQALDDTYTVAIGVQAFPLGISGRYDEDKWGVEGSLTSRQSWQRMTAFYENEYSMDNNGLKFIWGFGADFMTLNSDWKNSQGYYGSDGSFGIAGIVGFDKKIIESPFDITVNWQPNVNVYGINKAFLTNMAVAVRYAFQ